MNDTEEKNLRFYIDIAKAYIEMGKLNSTEEQLWSKTKEVE